MSNVFVACEFEGDGDDILGLGRLKVFSSKDKADAYMAKRIAELGYDFERITEITEDVEYFHDIFLQENPSCYDAYVIYVAKVPGYEWSDTECAIYGIAYELDEEDYTND